MYMDGFVVGMAQGVTLPSPHGQGGDTPSHKPHTHSHTLVVGVVGVWMGVCGWVWWAWLRVSPLHHHMARGGHPEPQATHKATQDPYKATHMKLLFLKKKNIGKLRGGTPPTTPHTQSHTHYTPHTLIL